MRVLVIEDDGASRAILISTLRARRHEVVACEDAEAAWAAIGAETSPQVSMPGLGGEATLHEIRRRWPALPIVVSSGDVPEDDRELDGVPFLAEPYRPAELIDLFRRVLEPAV